MKREREADWADHYDSTDILEEIEDDEVDLSLDEEIRRDIAEGRRKRRLKSITIKLDPMQIRAIKKIAAMKCMPYQTLIRHWLSEDIKGELGLVAK